MPVRNTAMDDEIRPLIQYADDHLGEWVVFHVLDDQQLHRTVRWFVVSGKSPFGWSPDGKPQTAIRAFDLMWQMPNDDWSRDIKAPGKFHNGNRIGRLKLWVKKQRSDNG